LKSKISKYIEDKITRGEKILSVFLTSGFPEKDIFVELALNVLDAGADMLEIGFPFSDPIADGPIIQQSSQTALRNGINLHKTLNFVKEINEHTEKPIILMGYANPLLNYGLVKFADDSKRIGVDGLIVPDIPLDEYDNFFTSKFDGTDIILLITDNLQFIKNAYEQCTNNRVLVGFGISSVEDVKYYKPHCDGVIVGSAVIKSLMNDNSKYQKTLELVRKLKGGLVD